MKIDIVDLSDPAYSSLSPVQLAMVRAAQMKKNDADSTFRQERERLVATFINHGLGTSTQLAAYIAEAAATRDEKVEEIRETLNYQLAYESIGTEGNENGPYRYPENPNYALSPSQRFIVVRNYYMEAVNDPKARLEALRGDTLARSYLGDFYATLIDLFVSDI